MASTGAKQPVPVFLLKTRSSPQDAYQEILSAGRGDGVEFDPTFIPVLEHKLDEQGVSQLEALIRAARLGASVDCAYGGLIFTSQRAVEAFSKLAAETPDSPGWSHVQQIPIYSVGPATTRALRAIPLQPPLQIFGEHTGNGDALGQFILQHYHSWYEERKTKPPLLFIVGEKRRDAIPKLLMDPSLPMERRIQVDEIVVYATGVMESFGHDFARQITRTQHLPLRWVVVFSPTGCDGMLSSLGKLDEATGKAKPGEPHSTALIATIGPTTQKYLQNTFNLDPDVCSEHPTPESLFTGIANYTENQHRSSTI